MRHQTFAKQHRLFTYGVCVFLGILLGILIDNVILCAVMGAIFATTFVYGEPRSSGTRSARSGRLDTE